MGVALHPFNQAIKLPARGGVVFGALGARIIRSGDGRGLHGGQSFGGRFGLFEDLALEKGGVAQDETGVPRVP